MRICFQYFPSVVNKQTLYLFERYSFFCYLKITLQLSVDSCHKVLSQYQSTLKTKKQSFAYTKPYQINLYKYIDGKKRKWKVNQDMLN